MSVDSVFSEGVATVATVEAEKSVPVQICEMVAKGKAYLQHAKQLRQKHDAESSQRGSDHQRLVASGVGPVKPKEIEQLQQSMWQWLAADECELRELIRALQAIAEDRAEQHAESQRLIQKYRADAIERLVRDFCLSKSNADARMLGDADLVALKQLAEDIRQQAESVKKMIRVAEGDIRAIEASRAKLSREWRKV